MKACYNKLHPAVKHGFVIGTRLRHRTNGRRLGMIEIIGYRDCREEWGENNYYHLLCLTACPNAYVILKVKNCIPHNIKFETGFMNTGYWCVGGESDMGSTWKIVGKKNEKSSSSSSR